ncbi:hypothetical protein [Tunturibacter empetritectus]|uniref:Uncharacterized protein n=1 Tax=Tunturiibacter lichenicola TaxID=2051959 RepID=A0A7W8N3T5_9BACT|nr:hypothetical protein [Edaphobacter lichenicola]MBB5344524.1 hypothetical protein [Edaphobacter lichenicola]
MAFAAGIGAQYEEERDRSDHDTGDDDQQERAAEGLSFLRRRGGGGGHVGLDAGWEVREILLRGERVVFLGFFAKTWWLGVVF